MDETDPQPGLTVEASIDLPGGAYAESSLLIVSYIDHDGNHRYGWRNTGEGSVATMLGLMDIIQVNMIAETMS